MFVQNVTKGVLTITISQVFVCYRLGIHDIFPDDLYFSRLINKAIFWGNVQ